MARVVYGKTVGRTFVTQIGAGWDTLEPALNMYRNALWELKEGIEGVHEEAGDDVQYENADVLGAIHRNIFAARDQLEQIFDRREGPLERDVFRLAEYQWELSDLLYRLGYGQRQMAQIQEYWDESVVPAFRQSLHYIFEFVDRWDTIVSFLAMYEVALEKVQTQVNAAYESEAYNNLSQNFILRLSAFQETLNEMQDTLHQLRDNMHEREIPSHADSLTLQNLVRQLDDRYSALEIVAGDYSEATRLYDTIILLFKSFTWTDESF